MWVLQFQWLKFQGRTSPWWSLGDRRRWRCWICKTDGHWFRDCTKCRICKKDGHWAQNCPENLQNQADWDRGDREQGGGSMGEQPTAMNQGSEHLWLTSDLHTALCNEENACSPLEVSAMSNVSDKCLTTYKSGGFFRNAQIFQDGGRNTSFLFSRFWSRTICITTMWLAMSSDNDKQVHESTTASGHQIFEKLIEPLTCETEGGRMLKHAFLYSSGCTMGVRMANNKWWLG